MKVRVIYSIAACLTCVVTLVIFLDFRKQWKAADTFRGAIHNAPLSTRHLFIAPEQVNVENWQVGDSAVYHLKTNTEHKQISFQIAAQDTQDRKKFWLRTHGLLNFNEVEIELWRLLDKANLRPGNESQNFYFSPDAIPFPFPPLQLIRNPVVLEKLGEEAVATPMGALMSEHYFAYIRSPDGGLEPLLELWTHPSIRPLGLVRARWQDASLDLVEVNTQTSGKTLPVLSAIFDKNTFPIGSCIPCHDDEIGGKNLKLEYINIIRGEALNLTTALFHHRQAKFIKPKDLIHLHFTEKSRQAMKLSSAQFSWNKGSFWVESDAQDQVRIAMDTIAHQGNITVQANMGDLVLEIQW